MSWYHLFFKCAGIAFSITAAIGTIAVYGLAISDWSTDFGWHYILVRYIGENLTLPGADMGRFGPMRNYPPGAHAISALLGLIVDHTLAMNLIAIGAIYATYVALAFAAPSHSRAAIVAAGVAALIVIRHVKYNVLSGTEIRGNFFFAQVTGDALLVVLVVLLARWRDLFRPVAIPITCALAILIGTVYNLSAVKFLACTAAMLTYAILGTLGTVRFRRNALTSMGIVTAIGLAVVLHPNFFGMVSNAAYNGGILIAPRTVITIATLLLACGLALAWMDHANQEYRAIVALSVGSSAAAFGQFAALKLFNLGSPYAVGKHGYLLFTLLIISLAAVAMAAGQRLRKITMASPSWAEMRYAPAIFLGAVGIWAALGQPGQPIASYIAYQAALDEIARTYGVKGNTLSINHRFTAPLNFTAAMGNLQLAGWSPIALEQELFLRADKPVAPKALALFAVISNAQRQQIADNCVIDDRPDLAIALIHIRCVRQDLPNS